MDFRSREEEFQLEKASWAESIAIWEEFRPLIKEIEEPSESENARQAHEIYKAMENEEWAWSDEYDEEKYPDPELRPHSPVNYRPPINFISFRMPSPPRARPPRAWPPPPPPASCFRKMKSLSLDDQVLEKKTGGESSEINDKHGHKKNNNRVVSKRKMKRARNMEKKRRGKGEVS